MSRITILILVQILFLTLALSTTGQLQLNFAGGKCRANDTITTNSTYHTNILTLLTDLHSLSTVNLFFISSAGATADRVNGFYLCRPDLPLTNCEACINATIDLLNENCFDKKSAIAWYYECMIQYSNSSLAPSDANATDPWTYWYGTLNVSQPEIFPALLNNTIQTLISDAISSDNERRLFAYGKTNFTDFETLYAMVLCRPDITAQDCESCLTIALDRIPTCCVGFSSWTIIFMPSCQLRYDTAPFIFSIEPTELLLAPSSPPSLAPAPAPGG